MKTPLVRIITVSSGDGSGVVTSLPHAPATESISTTHNGIR